MLLRLDSGGGEPLKKKATAKSKAKAKDSASKTTADILKQARHLMK